MAFSSQTTSEKSSVPQKWMGDRLSPLCPVSLLIPDSRDTHFSAQYTSRILPRQCLFPWLLLRDGCLLQDLSLSFLHPTVVLTSSCSFPSLSFLYPLYYLKFPLGCSWHFKPNCLMVHSPDPWPPLLMVPPSFQSLRLETSPSSVAYLPDHCPLPTFQFITKSCTLSFPCNSPITFPLLFLFWF